MSIFEKMEKAFEQNNAEMAAECFHEDIKMVKILMNAKVR